MAITCICPQCRKQLSIDEQFAGQPMKCPMCAGMFQAPSRTTLAGVGASAPAPTPAYSGPAPYWQAPPPPPDAAAPEWPWLVGQAPAAGAPGAAAGYDWGAVKNDALRLAPGWHMVRRGLAFLPPFLILLLAGTALGILFKLMAEEDTAKVALLMIIPVTLIASLCSLVALALCCAVPQESGSKLLVVGATAGMFIALLGGVISALLTLAADSSSVANFLRYPAYVFTAIAAIGAGALFLLFLRGVALVFGNHRLGQHVLWFLLVFAGAPFLGLFVYFLFSATAKILMSDAAAANLVVAGAEIVLAAILLGGLLLLLRDVRGSIERAQMPRRS